MESFAYEGRELSRRNRLVRIVADLKAKPCMDCGREYPGCCMDFDHRPGTQKLATIGYLVGRGVNVDALMREIDKCDLVCANCHRIRTRDRKRGRNG
jgi:hypothetical protein